jgi:prolyl-tRNA synthetase
VTRVLAEETLRGGRYVVGANREGYHLTGVEPGVDFPCEFVDLQVALPGEGCPQCSKPVRIERVIEIGNIFKLGTRYSDALGATYLDETGQDKPVVMGSYGIGPARIAAGAIEQSHDADGIVWPWAIAPFQVHLVPVGARDSIQGRAGDEIYRELQSAGLEVLLDDRDERAGVKFKDADLLGLPIRVTVGNLLAKEGLVELRTRRDRSDQRVPRAGVAQAIRDLARSLSGGA